jgi:hypothetical protein
MQKIPDSCLKTIIARTIIYDSVLKSMPKVLPFLLRIPPAVRQILREGARREHRSQNNYITALILKDQNRQAPPNQQPDQEIDISF